MPTVFSLSVFPLAELLSLIPVYDEETYVCLAHVNNRYPSLHVTQQHLLRKMQKKPLSSNYSSIVTHWLTCTILNLKTWASVAVPLYKVLLGNMTTRASATYMYNVCFCLFSFDSFPICLHFRDNWSCCVRNGR
jgi:hypothetical protein